MTTMSPPATRKAPADAKRPARRGLSLWRAVLVFVAPFGVLYALFYAVPIGYAIYQSLLTVERQGTFGPATQVFGGFTQYVQVFQDTAFWTSVGRVLIFLRNRPSDLGVARYGEADAAPRPVRPTVGAARLALTALRDAARTRTFWLLAAGFAICGATTNGLVGTHFIPSAHDHGMPQTTAAGLLAVVGIFDIVGTVFSGWLTDRVNPRILLLAYYALRGVGLAFLPALLSAEVQPSIVVFVVIYGLDWVATVPPTIALCREAFGDRGPLVFGWVFAAHQVGAAIAAVLAGIVRDQTGQYTVAWFAAAGLCAVAAVVSISIRRHSDA